MSDEQRNMAHFKAQPEGTGLLFRPAALSSVCIERLNGTDSALPDKKTASGIANEYCVNRPWWSEMVFGPFAETKGPRRRGGETPDFNSSSRSDIKTIW